MAQAAGGPWLNVSSDDDVEEIRPSQAYGASSNLDGPPNPLALESTPIFSPAPPFGSRRRRRLSRWDQPPVIDLTEEPDSPDQPQTRNPRRTNSQRASPPRLARSDNTLFAPAATFIDLTGESPDDGIGAASPRHVHLRHHHLQPHPRHPRPHPSTRRPRPFSHDQLVELEFLDGDTSFYGQFARGVHRMAGIIQSELLRSNLNRSQLDTSVPRLSSPKPAMEHFPGTRGGFTRDTCSNPKDTDECVVVCPACNEELVYDPTNAPALASSAGTCRKRKRAPGEHHFWALKRCGHVSKPSAASIPANKPTLLTHGPKRCIVPTVLRTAGRQRRRPTAWGFATRPQSPP